MTFDDRGALAMRPLVVLVLLSLALSACSRAHPAAVEGDAGAAARSGLARDASPLAAAEPLDAGVARPRAFLPCRAIAVTGHPTIEADGGARPLAARDPANGWITLAAGDTVIAKFPKSGREVSLVGPGVVDPCADEGDGGSGAEAWVESGLFQGGRGAGETPGAEEWVVTPSAVVRYGAATIDVRVEQGTVTATLKGGAASLLSSEAAMEAAKDAGAEAWQPLTAATARVANRAPLFAAKRCADAEAAAEAIEARVLAPGATTTPTFGDDARRAGEARLLARAVCAMAKVQLHADLERVPHPHSKGGGPNAGPNAP